VPEPFEILVVCVGNVCRSPLAERMLRLRFSELLEDQAAVTVGSAGVGAMVGSGMQETAASELRRLGGDPDGFVARQYKASMAEQANLVLTATRDLRSRVLEEVPRALKRTFTIRELATLLASDAFRESRPASTDDLVSRAAAWRGSVAVDSYDVPDPIGESKQVHREVADLLDRDCSVIARVVAAALERGLPESG
jgi:protein-tyrosine phosphatase